MPKEVFTMVLPDKFDSIKVMKGDKILCRVYGWTNRSYASFEQMSELGQKTCELNAKFVVDACNHYAEYCTKKREA